jgi:hypothetical protein
VKISYHILIKNEYASAIIDSLQKMNAVELLPEHSFEVPQWQIEEIRERRNYYKEHPEELISWEDAQKMIKTD